MRNVLNLVGFFLIASLNSSCALGLGQRRECVSPTLPTRPPELVCIPNELGNANCWNPITQKYESHNVKNYVCKDISGYNRTDEWINDVLRACRGE